MLQFTLYQLSFVTDSLQSASRRLTGEQFWRVECRVHHIYNLLEEMTLQWQGWRVKSSSKMSKLSALFKSETHAALIVNTMRTHTAAALALDLAVSPPPLWALSHHQLTSRFTIFFKGSCCMLALTTVMPQTSTMSALVCCVCVCVCVGLPFFVTVHAHSASYPK